VTEETTSRIRRAIASQQYDEALELWNAHCAQLRRSIFAGAASEAILREAGELVAWAQEYVLGARAHMQDQMNSLHVAEVYTRTMARDPNGRR
jgi:hypothetical protein